MAKNLKLNIKNTQLAKAINLDSVKDKLAKKKAPATKEKEPAVKQPAAPKAKLPKAKPAPRELQETIEVKEDTPKIRARSRSVFAEPEKREDLEEVSFEEPSQESESEVEVPLQTEEVEMETEEAPHETFEPIAQEEIQPIVETVIEEIVAPEPTPEAPVQKEPEVVKPVVPPVRDFEPLKPVEPKAPPVKLGPTGRHVKDLLPADWGKKKPLPTDKPAPGQPPKKSSEEKPKTSDERAKEKIKEKPARSLDLDLDDEEKKKGKSGKFKEFKDLKPAKKQDKSRFDSRDRQGLRESDEDLRWRKRRHKSQKYEIEDTTIRPSSLKIRVPISIKDLAVQMKLKASQLVEKLFMQGLVLTLNDLLDDETTIQLLGQEFGCEITIDSSEQERIRITDKTIKEEVALTSEDLLEPRAPIVAFMGHVDHGKTSLIDAIRKSNRAASEAGAITQHIGAFRCKTAVGDIAILDTPGHEAFSAMRARGADATDIVVLVVAGDEGIRQQTIEAIQQAKEAKVTIVVAINKCDKPNFDQELVYRQLSEQELLPEAWGGTTITVNCSAVTGQGIPELLEMLALQSEVLELKAAPSARARGVVLESEMHKGLGPVATVLVQNGTLKVGNACVFDYHFGRIKTMRDEFGNPLQEAGPSTPVEVTGLSGLPEAGQEFIVVKDEKEAKIIADVRSQDRRQTTLTVKKAVSLEKLMEGSKDVPQKTLTLILRADVQGSLEALRVGLLKIESKKVDLNIIFAGVGEISESDVQFANASNAVIIGFHTQIEGHAEPLIKQYGVIVKLHDIIYHAIDDVKELMAAQLDKIAIETDKAKVEVRATFKSSQHGVIAGCYVLEGTVNRNYHVKLIRAGSEIWKGSISSLKRVKDDVREVSKGFECGILLGTNDVQAGDLLNVYEVTYIKQTL